MKAAIASAALLLAAPFTGAGELPVRAGMPAVAAIEALGEQTLFAPDCLDRTGPALLAPVVWRGEPMWAAVLLDGSQVSGLRLHARRDPIDNADRGRCESEFQQLAARLARHGIAARGVTRARFDGPYFRWTQPTRGGGRLVAVWRASRASCQAWYEPPL